MSIRTGSPPASEEEFKEFVSKRVSGSLEKHGIASADDLFVSKRDGQPFVIFYGQKPKGVSSDLVAYEQTGVDGKRWVGYQLGNVEEVDEQRFSELVPASAAP